MQKILFISLIALIALFQYWLWYGNDGYIMTSKLEADFESQVRLNKELQQRNNELSAQIHNIRGTRASLDAKSRYELNLIKPDETLVILPDK